MPLSWLCPYGLLCAFDEAKMAPKWRGKWGVETLVVVHIVVVVVSVVARISATKMDVAIFLEREKACWCECKRDRRDLPKGCTVGFGVGLKLALASIGGPSLKGRRRGVTIPCWQFGCIEFTRILYALCQPNSVQLYQ